MRLRTGSPPSRPDPNDNGGPPRTHLRHPVGSAASPDARVVAIPTVAQIDETACIGCALCLEACPVDAIVGAPRRMHTVIAAECIGCRLCLPPCPVDCITMVDTGKALTREERRSRAAKARRRYLGRIARRGKLARTGRTAGAERKREAVELALQRARQRLRKRAGA